MWVNYYLSIHTHTYTYMHIHTHTYKHIHSPTHSNTHTYTQHTSLLVKEKRGSCRGVRNTNIHTHSSLFILKRTYLCDGYLANYAELRGAVLTVYSWNRAPSFNPRRFSDFLRKTRRKSLPVFSGCFFWSFFGSFGLFFIPFHQQHTSKLTQHPHAHASPQDAHRRPLHTRREQGGGGE